MSIARLLNIAGLLRTVPAIIILSLSFSFGIHAQTSMPEVLDTATLRQQLEYMNERMNIYNERTNELIGSLRRFHEEMHALGEGDVD